MRFMDTKAQKENLRIKLKVLRLKKPRQEVEELSQQIVGRFIESVNWLDIKTIHIYASIPSLNEVQTLPLINYLREKYPRIDVFIEAQSAPKKIPSRKFDLVIVPILAFDKKGHRLGWGGGFYDRFLTTQPKALKIGLAYQSSLIKGGIPDEEHDIPLNQIITEEYNYIP